MEVATAGQPRPCRLPDSGRVDRCSALTAPAFMTHLNGMLMAATANLCGGVRR